MSFTHNAEPNFTGKAIMKKWSEWKLNGGDWQSYLRYLKSNNALSKNFVLGDNGYLQLREGYNPPWEMKDFK